MISLQNVTLGYGETAVIPHLSLDIPKGSFFTLIGPNGSGKSTLLGAMAGLLTPIQGEIYVNQKPLSHHSKKELAKQISYLPQTKAIPQMTVEQLVLHGRFPYMGYPRGYTKEDREITKEVLETLGLTQYAQNSLATLSGGMRQKAYLAMALCTQSECLILDEPTTYLDIAHQRELTHLLKTLCNQGKTVIAVLHDLPLAFAVATHVGVLEQGNLLAVESPQTLWQSPLIPKVFGVELGKIESCYYYK